jgi:SAM-dependent methyltransferase
MNFKKQWKHLLDDPVQWPPLDEQMNVYRQYIQGLVLNAGSGRRKQEFEAKSHGNMIHLDLVGAHRPDVVADLHALPFKDDVFDTLLNIAVLMHCERPWEVVQEFRRVLKNGGIVICDMPFLQPVQNDPTDYYRLTQEGLRALFEYYGFETLELHYMHGLSHVLGQIIYDWLRISVHLRWVRYLVFPLIYLFTKHIRQYRIWTCPSANVIVARIQKKP